MTAQAVILTPIRHGWAVELTGGKRVAEFHGPGTRIRAQRYLAQVRQRGARDDRGSSSEWNATC